MRLNSSTPGCYGSLAEALGWSLPAMHEVHGNVQEWCSDGHAAAPVFAPGDGRQRGDDEQRRAFRGGSFQSPAQVVRSAWRHAMTKDWRSHDLGCRAARPLLRGGA